MPEVDTAASVLEAGGIVAFPTETFYGLAVLPHHHEAVEKLLALKARAGGQGIPLIASSSAAADRLVDPETEELASLRETLQRQFWPGPLTLVVAAHQSSTSFHEGIFGPDESLAVRVSSRLEARELAARVGGVITATSANPHGLPPSDSSAVVRGYFPEMYVLEEYTDFERHQLPSTILDIRTIPSKVIREGAVSRSVLGRMLPGLLP
jgi:L-threonylcarbamoyladenylate synthase